MGASGPSYEITRTPVFDYPNGLLRFESYYDCGSSFPNKGIKDRVLFPEPNEMAVSCIDSLDIIRTINIRKEPFPFKPPAVIAPGLIIDTTFYYSGDMLTPSFNVNRPELLITDYNLLPWAPAPSGNYWDFAAASVYKSDAYIDRLRLFVAEYPDSFDVGVTSSGEIKPWALGALIEPDSTDPEIAEDTCCATVFEGPDTMTLYFTVDTNNPLELVVREIPSYFFGIDTIDSPGRMLLVQAYDAGQQTWDTLDVVPSRSMAGFALVEVDDDYIIENSNQLKLRLIWDSYYAIDIVGIDTIDGGVKVDTLTLNRAILGDDTLTSDLTSVDSVYVRVGMDNALEYRFSYSAPGSYSQVLTYPNH